MKKIMIVMMLVIAVLTASAQTEKTRGFDDLSHYIENLDVFEYGQEEARAYYMPGHHILLNGKRMPIPK